MNDSLRILIGSPVRQKSNILREFLLSLADLDHTGFETDFMFIDNNDNEISSLMLDGFCPMNSNVFISKEPPGETYLCNDLTHNWKDSLIWKLATFKDGILEYAQQKGYSHVMLVDSDLVLHPNTLKHLLSTGKDIISEIFWTRWVPEADEEPNVWLMGQYSFSNEKCSADEFIKQLRRPGIYEVGGLGACTLISRKAISAGIKFQRISNLDYWGEDRHFCVRAAVLGFNLYVDTRYPALHLYRNADLAKVQAFRNACSLQNN